MKASPLIIKTATMLFRFGIKVMSGFLGSNHLNLEASANYLDHMRVKFFILSMSKIRYNISEVTFTFRAVLKLRH